MIWQWRDLIEPSQHKRYNLHISQLSPLELLVHWQLYLLIKSMHVPLWRQGSLLHSSISVMYMSNLLWYICDHQVTSNIFRIRSCQWLYFYQTIHDKIATYPYSVDYIVFYTQYWGLPKCQNSLRYHSFNLILHNI